MKYFYNALIMSIVISILALPIGAKALTYLFSHGAFDWKNQAFKYARENIDWWGNKKERAYYIMDGPLKLFNFPDVFSCKLAPRWLPKLWEMSLGQENEVVCLRKACDEIKDENVVLVGVSRGASAGVVFLGEDDPEKVKAAVLVSAYDRVSTVFSHHWFTTILSIIPLVTNQSLYKFFLLVSKFKENGLHPITSIDKINKKKAILLVCSKKDGTVPYRSTIDLYKKLLEAGHEKSHLLVLDSGRHAKMLKSEEAETFQNVVYSFYEHCGFLSNENDKILAKKGAKRFAQCQPDLQQVEKLLKYTPEAKKSCFESCKGWCCDTSEKMWNFGAKVLNSPFEVR